MYRQPGLRPSEKDPLTLIPFVSKMAEVKVTMVKPKQLVRPDFACPEECTLQEFEYLLMASSCFSMEQTVGQFLDSLVLLPEIKEELRKFLVGKPLDLFHPSQFLLPFLYSYLAPVTSIYPNGNAVNEWSSQFVEYRGSDFAIHRKDFLEINLGLQNINSLRSAITNILSHRPLEEGFREYYHLDDRVKNMMVLSAGLTPYQFTGIYDFGHGFYLASQLEHTLLWLKNKKDCPVSILVFRVPDSIFNSFSGLNISDANADLFNDVVTSSLKQPTRSFPTDYIEGPCCGNSVQVARCHGPKIMKTPGGILLRQLALNSATCQRKFFEESIIYVINLPFRR